MKFVSILSVLIACLVLAPDVRAQTAACAEPNVLVLFDVSGSMNHKINASDTNTKYVTAQRAISKVVQNTEHRMRYGLTLFPQPGTAPVYCGGETYEVNVPFAVNNWQSIFNKISPTLYNSTSANPLYFGGPRGDFDTPMVQALRAARTASGLAQSGRRSYVILVSDGSQDCARGGDYNTTPDAYPNGSPYCTYGAGGTCPGPYAYNANPTSPYWNPTEYAANRDDAVLAVDDMWWEGIDTFVVGFGAGADPATLNELAVYGGTADWECTQNCYFHADNQAQLEAALEAIAQIVAVEVCDGIDNNCDGNIDEGTALACETSCGAGQQLCVEGALAACDAPVASTEICDGLDNNCNNDIDEGCGCIGGESRSCGSDVGACVSGTQTCVAGQWGPCNGAQGPTQEICDGANDEDCDDTVDEGCGCTNGANRRCGTSEGACEPGTQTCANGIWGECEGDIEPTTETCDGVDNDCDGSTDEHCGCITGNTQACGSSFGICSPGLQTCVDGEWSDCSGDTQSQVEVCDNVDNDCDGDTDEEASCGATLQCRCGSCVGACGANNSCPSGSECKAGFCVIDSCPANSYCDGNYCVPGTDPNGNGSGSGETDGDGHFDPKAGVDGGCNCSQTTDPVRAAADMALLGLVMIGLQMFRRKKATACKTG